jgi:hypothetical protein
MCRRFELEYKEIESNVAADQTWLRRIRHHPVSFGRSSYPTA